MAVERFDRFERYISTRYLPSRLLDGIYSEDEIRNALIRRIIQRDEKCVFSEDVVNALADDILHQFTALPVVEDEDTKRWFEPLVDTRYVAGFAHGFALAAIIVCLITLVR